MAIRRAAKPAGVKVPTIRYHETVGPLLPPSGLRGSRRTRGMDDVRRLGCVRRVRDPGSRLGAIRRSPASAGSPEGLCGGADAIARIHVADAGRRIARSVTLRGELEATVGRGPRGRIAECRVIEVLADRAGC